MHLASAFDSDRTICAITADVQLLMAPMMADYVGSCRPAHGRPVIVTLDDCNGMACRMEGGLGEGGVGGEAGDGAADMRMMTMLVP